MSYNSHAAKRVLSTSSMQAASATGAVAGAGSRDPPRTRSASRLSLKPILKDFICLTDHKSVLVEQRADGGINIPHKPTVSIGNAWLQMLGAPVRFKLKRTRRGAPYKSTLEALLGRSDSQHWDVSVLYVTQTSKAANQQSLEGFKDLQCDFVFGMFAEDLKITIPSCAKSEYATTLAGAELN